MNNHTVELTQSEVSTLLSYLDAGAKFIGTVSEDVKTIVSKLEGAADAHYNKFAHFDWEQARAEAVVDTVGAERVLQQIQDMVMEKN
jgi:hypothetical protein